MTLCINVGRLTDSGIAQTTLGEGPGNATGSSHITGTVHDDDRHPTPKPATERDQSAVRGETTPTDAEKDVDMPDSGRASRLPTPVPTGIVYGADQSRTPEAHSPPADSSHDDTAQDNDPAGTGPDVQQLDDVQTEQTSPPHVHISTVITAMSANAVEKECKLQTELAVRRGKRE
jgi:hypothetical protein